MRYENEVLGVSFEIAEQFTVREQLAFRAAVASAAGETNYVRYWQAAQTLVTEWACELVPEPESLDLDAVYDTRVADVVQWTANTVAGHMLKLEMPPKN